jgi:hypothetical protein
MLGIGGSDEEIKETPELEEEYQEIMNTKVYTDQDREMACKACGWTYFVSPHSGKRSRPQI